MPCEIIPAIDLKDGRCVRLYQGELSQVTVFSENPVEMALHWEALGAPRLHVVDLDGAATGQPQNLDIINAICKSVNIPVQVGGGIRDMGTARLLLNQGAQRVILGTAAVAQPSFAEKAALELAESVVVALDARSGKVVTEAWRAATEVSLMEFFKKMLEAGVPRFIHTDVSRDGTLRGPNLDGLKELLAISLKPIIASGGIASLEDLRAVQALGVEGAIVGRALYTGQIRLEEALKISGQGIRDGDRTGAPL